MEAKLVVVGGKANKAEVKLKLPTVIGRGRDADLTVAHGTVSRHHCMIYELDGALVVRDNGSLNGTLVEGQRIKESLLRPGDTLTIGPLTFRAEYEHHGAFPSLGEQPTTPNFQDTVGDVAATSSASEPPTLRNDEAGRFDFLNSAAAQSAPAADDGEAFDVPDFKNNKNKAPAENGRSKADDQAESAIGGEEATLDFIAGGSDVAPVSDDDAPSFGFLDQQAAGSSTVEEEAPAFNIHESEEAPDTEPAEKFDFVNSASEPAVEDDAPAIETSIEMEAGVEGTPATEDAAAEEHSGFSFLDHGPAATLEKAPSFDFNEAAQERAVQPAGEFSFLGTAGKPAAEDEALAIEADARAEEAVAPRATEEADAEAASGFSFLDQEVTPAQEEARSFNFNEAGEERAEEPAQNFNHLDAVGEPAKEEPPAFEEGAAAAEAAEDATPLTLEPPGQNVSDCWFPGQEPRGTGEAPSFESNAAADEGQASEEPVEEPAESFKPMDTATHPVAEDDAPAIDAGASAEAAANEPPAGELADAGEASGFNFLDHESAAAREEAPSFNFNEAAPDARPADERGVDAAESFDLLNISSAPAAEDEAGEILEERLSDETGVKEASGFSFLNSDGLETSPAAESPSAFAFDEAANSAADDTPENMPQFDFGPAFSAPAGHETAAVNDDSPKFGYLGSLSSADEADASLPELTLHDAEESENEAAGLADAPELTSNDGSSLKFDDETQAADERGGFSFLNVNAEPEAEFGALAPHEAPRDSEEAADDDSGEFVLPLDEPATTGDESGFNFLSGESNGDAEAAAPENADEEAAEEGEYAISLAPPSNAIPRTTTSFEPAEDNGEADEIVPESRAEAEKETAEEPAVEPVANAKKRRGWWPFGKGKTAEPSAPKTKNQGNGPTVAGPMAMPQAAMPEPAAPASFAPVANADPEEAALSFLSDPAGSSPDEPAASHDSDVKINTGEPAKKSAAGGDEELDDFFNSIGLD